MRDVEYVVKVSEGQVPMPSDLHFGNMISRYNAEIFRVDKFKYVRNYRSALESMAGRKDLVGVDVSKLRMTRVELLNYYHKVHKD